MQVPISYLDFEKIRTNSMTCAIVKQTIDKIKLQNGYYTLGEFLNDQSKLDLNMLSVMIDAHQLVGDDDESTFNICILTELLIVAEGGQAPKTGQEMHSNYNFFSAMLTAESLKRKGFVTIDYSKLSFLDTEREGLVTLVLE